MKVVESLSCVKAEAYLVEDELYSGLLGLVGGNSPDQDRLPIIALVVEKVVRRTGNQSRLGTGASYDESGNPVNGSEDPKGGLLASGF